MLDAYTTGATPWPSAASNTFTVPTTFTAAPKLGSARQNGICSAARWITRSTPAMAAATASPSVMSPVTRSKSNGRPPATNSWRALLAPWSNTRTSSPPSSSRRTTQAPMQPSAPVTRKRSPISRSPVPRRCRGTIRC